MMNRVRHNISQLINRFLPALISVCVFVLAGCEYKAPSEEEYETSLANCWPCIMYDKVFSSVNEVVNSLSDTMSEYALLVLGVGLLFWLAFTIGKMISSLEPPKIPEYYHLIRVTLFKALAVGAMLSVPDGFICMVEWIVTPVLESFIGLSRIMTNAVVDISTGQSLPDNYMTVIDVSHTCQVFSKQLQYDLEDVIYRIYVALNAGIALGTYMMFQPYFVGWIIGAFVVWCFFMLSFIMPLMFVDSLFRLGAVIVMAPFLFVSWVFPSTKSYLKKAWEILFGALMQLLFASIYIGLFVAVLRIYGDAHFPSMVARSTSSPAFAGQMRRVSVDAFSFMALIYIIYKMHKCIPQVSGYFGGDAAESAASALVNTVGKVLKAAAKMAVGYVTGNAKMMAEGASEMKKAVEDSSQKQAHMGSENDPAMQKTQAEATKGVQTGGDNG